jgi:hypothetical protein
MYKFPMRNCVNIIACLSDSRRGVGLDIGFIDRLQVVITSNYNIIVNFQNLQITTAHAKTFQSAVSLPVVSWQRI